MSDQLPFLLQLIDDDSSSVRRAVATAILDLDGAGIPMKLEASDEKFRGLSHREWGDATEAFAFLIETPNPNQVKGARDVEPVFHPEYPLALRVGAQLATVLTVVAHHGATVPPGRRVELEPGPDFRAVGAKGLAAYLRW